MTDGIPQFPQHFPFTIPDDKGKPSTMPTPKGVAVIETSRKMARELTKAAIKMKAPKKTKMKKKLDVKWY